MMTQLLYLVGFVVAFVGLLFGCEVLHVKFHVQTEITRKLAHTVATLISLVFLLTFQSYIYVVIMGAIFFLILYVGKRIKFFTGIDEVKRKTAGSYLLPLAIGSLFIIYMQTSNSLLFIFPILVLGISDPLAGIFGTLYRERTRPIRFFQRTFDKTVLGSSVFFLATFVLGIITFYGHDITDGRLILLALGLAMLGTLVELFSTHGWDNITVPLVLSLVLYLLQV
jgi:phytol kinase